MTKNRAGCFRAAIRKYDMIYVTSQLAIMVDTGITLSVGPGQHRGAGEEPDAAESAERAEIAASRRATIFPSALAKHPKHFDKTYVSLIKASEATGTLGDMLESHRQLSCARNWKRAAKSARRWPIRR